MERRAYLTSSVVLAASIAGCNGSDSDDEETDTPSEAGDGADGTATPTPTATATPQPASLELASVQPGDASVAPGESIDVSATVRNAGEVEGTADVTILLAGQPLATETVTVGADSETSVGTTVPTTDLQPGDYEVGFRVGDTEQTATLTVLAPGSLAFESISPTSTERQQGESAIVTATVRNDGGTEASGTVTLLLAGEEQNSQSVTLGAGEETTLSETIETADLAVQDHEFRFETANDSIAATLTVLEPLPDPVVEQTLIPDPTEEDISQDGNDFSVTVTNDGDTGEIGATLVFTVLQFTDPWDEDLEPQGTDTATVEAGAQHTFTVNGTPDPTDEYYDFRLWPAQVRADVANQGHADGTVRVQLLNDGNSVTTTDREIAVGETVTVDFRPDLSTTEPGELTVEAWVPE